MKIPRYYVPNDFTLSRFAVIPRNQYVSLTYLKKHNFSCHIVTCHTHLAHMPKKRDRHPHRVSVSIYKIKYSNYHKGLFRCCEYGAIAMLLPNLSYINLLATDDINASGEFVLEVLQVRIALNSIPLVHLLNKEEFLPLVCLLIILLILTLSIQFRRTARVLLEIFTK